MSVPAVSHEPLPAVRVPRGRIGLVGLGAVGARVARQLAPAVGPLPVSELRPGLTAALGRDLPLAAVTPDELDLVDLVVLAHPAPHLALAERFLRRGVHVVSTSDDLADVTELLELDDLAAAHGACLVVGAASSPGLSGLIAAELASRLDSVDELHVAVHGTGGPSCARQHHRILGGTALGWHDGQWLRRAGGSGRELCWFPEPIGGRDCYRAELVDPIVLLRAFPDVVRISARVSATRRDRLTARLPMLTPPHSEGGIGGLRVEVRGYAGEARRTEVAGAAERAAVTTAAVAATMAAFVVDGCAGAGPGVVCLGEQRLPQRELLDDVRARGIDVMEFAEPEQ